MMTEGWKKSTYSNGSGGHCVETRREVTAVQVRDTQNRESGALAFGAQEWTALLRAAGN